MRSMRLMGSASADKPDATLTMAATVGYRLRKDPLRALDCAGADGMGLGCMA